MVAEPLLDLRCQSANGSVCTGIPDACLDQVRVDVHIQLRDAVRLANLLAPLQRLVELLRLVPPDLHLDGKGEVARLHEPGLEISALRANN